MPRSDGPRTGAAGPAAQPKSMRRGRSVIITRGSARTFSKNGVAERSLFLERVSKIEKTSKKYKQPMPEMNKKTSTHARALKKEGQIHVGDKRKKKSQN